MFRQKTGGKPAVFCHLRCLFSLFRVIRYFIETIVPGLYFCINILAKESFRQKTMKKNIKNIHIYTKK